MLAVSNTSPISNLAIIDRLDLLPEQFEKIIIPGAVRRELEALSHSGARSAVEAALSAGWLQVQSVEFSPLIRLLSVTLHAGESEAIALGVETQAAWILLDEREARMTAQRMRLNITGVLGILLRAKKTGRLTALRPEIEKLRRKAHFFISPELEHQILRTAQE